MINLFNCLLAKNNDNRALLDDDSSQVIANIEIDWDRTPYSTALKSDH